MMFDELTKDLIVSGRKTVTRRLRKNDNKRPAIPNTWHKLKIDRTPKTYGYIYIISCEKSYLGSLTSYDAIMEGFNSKREYLDYFKQVNNEVNYSTPIWVIRFKYFSAQEVKNLWKSTK